MFFKKTAIASVLLLGFMGIALSQNADVWQKIANVNEQNLVNIEYYEEIKSTESISQIRKTKRYLTGVIVDSSGLIMTSASIYKAGMGFSGSTHFGPAHPPKDITVKTKNGLSQKAVFIGKDDDKNLAFIKTETPMPANGVPFIEKADMQIGEQIYVAFQLAEKYNFQFMVLEKRVNSILPGPPQKLLADIGLQNIGFGLVFDANASVIGIIYGAKPTHNAFSYGMRPTGFGEILPTQVFNALLTDPPRYKRKETARKKWLGINMQPFTREMAKYFNVPEVEGILINTILDDSPAQKAGLEIGDVLTAFDGHKLKAEKNTDLSILRSLVRESEKPVVSVEVWRKNSHKTFRIELTAMPISQHLADEVSNTLLGFSAKELTKDIIMAKKLDYDTHGVWISRIERAGLADLAGLNVGDLLLKVDEKELQSINQLNTYLGDFEDAKPAYIRLFIKRHSETRFLFIKTNFN